MLKVYLRSAVPLGASFCAFFAYVGAWQNFIGSAVFLVLVGVAVLAQRVGRAATGAKIMLFALWAAPSWCALHSGGLHSPLLMWFTPHVFVAAALLGWRAAIAAGAGSLMFTISMVPFRAALLQTTEFPPGDALDLLTAMSALSAIVLSLLYGVQFSRSATAAQDKLERAQAALKNRVDAQALHSVIAITDLKGRITYASPLFCEISQYSNEELIGQDHRILRSGHHPKSFWENAWATISAGKPWRGEVQNKAKDGSVYWVDTSIVPICDAAGQPCEYISIRTDITARKRAEQSALAAKAVAEHAGTIKTNFLATMSHEIRTPMNGVSGMAHLLGETTLTEEQRQYLDALTTSSTALLTLIDDILDYAKVEAGKLELDPEPFSVREMVEGVDELMRLKAEEKGLRFAAIVDRHVPDQVVGDAGRLRQILVNLANNAVKFTLRGSVVLRVNVTADRECGHMVHFSIEDTGVGMSEDVIKRLFAPFTQADASTTRRFGGTGLGLSISKQLCELMGGSVEVHSTQGRGSTFSFSVHVGRAEARPSPRLTHPINVLLLSDDGETREVLEESLGFVGASIEVCSDVGVVAECCEGTVDVVLYRPSLQEADVIARVEQLAEAEALKDTRLVVILPMQRLHLGEQLVEAGAHGVVSEPVRLSKLLPALAVDAGAPSEVRPVDPCELRGHVLLVDDNRINRVIAVRLLTKLGLQVSTSEDGQDATESILAGGFDLVLMDCQMPVMDGYEATRLLRALGGATALDALPIIALTAGAMRSDRDACVEAGMTDYLAKPIVPEKLRTTLAKYLPAAEPSKVAS